MAFHSLDFVQLTCLARPGPVHVPPGVSVSGGGEVRGQSAAQVVDGGQQSIGVEQEIQRRELHLGITRKMEKSHAPGGSFPSSLQLKGAMLVSMCIIPAAKNIFCRYATRPIHYSHRYYSLLLIKLQIQNQSTRGLLPCRWLGQSQA